MSFPAAFPTALRLTYRAEQHGTLCHCTITDDT